MQWLTVAGEPPTPPAVLSDAGTIRRFADEAKHRAGWWAGRQGRAVDWRARPDQRLAAARPGVRRRLRSPHRHAAAWPCRHPSSVRRCGAAGCLGRPGHGRQHHAADTGPHRRGDADQRGQPVLRLEQGVSNYGATGLQNSLDHGQHRAGLVEQGTVRGGMLGGLHVQRHTGFFGERRMVKRNNRGPKGASDAGADGCGRAGGAGIDTQYRHAIPTRSSDTQFRHAIQ